MGNLLRKHIGGDADCAAFIAAVGTLDSTEEDAICALIATLKADGIWDKCFAIYPFAGTTAAEQKWQLKDPRDLDAAYRLVFTTSPGFTHSITGAQMDAVGSTADTFLNANTVLSVSDAGLTCAVRSSGLNTQYALGGSTNPGPVLLMRTTLVGGRIGNATFIGSAPSPGVAEGVATITISGTTANAYKDGVLEGGPTTVSGGSFTSVNILFGLAELHEFCFGAIHTGLDATETANFHTAIDTYSATYTGRKNW